MLLDKIAAHARHTPRKIALEFLDPPLQTLTYQQLTAEIERTAIFLLQLGLHTGDRLALQLPKGLEFILLNLAAMRIGAVTVPLNPAYPLDELYYFLEDSGAKIFFTDQNTRPQIEEHIAGTLPGLEWIFFLEQDNPARWEEILVHAGDGIAPLIETPPPSPSAPAVMIYTSGTTGRPKGAVLTHANLTAQTEALHSAWGWCADDILLHALPLFHVHGLFVALHGALFAGATTLLSRAFDAQRALQTLVERRCTVFMGVPTIHRRLLDVPNAAAYDLGHIRLITSGSDRLPDEVFIGFQQTFGYTLLERYGMSETGMNLSNPLHGERRMGSVGLPLPGVEARIVHPETEEPLPDGEVGMVQVSGPHIFAGYWQQAEKTAEAFSPDGWLRTGDLGFREPDGYFTLQGRSKDLIITGGYNVYPPEVERVLAEHPAVAANAVIGCPDPEWGEHITAVVVLHPDTEVTGEDLIAFCQEKLARYKAPRRVVFAEGLPRNAMGKVQKNALRERLCI